MKRVLILVLLACSYAAGQTTAADVIPATTGQNLGNSGQRWNVYAQDIDVSRSISGNAKFGCALSVTGSSGAGLINKIAMDNCPFGGGTNPLWPKWVSRSRFSEINITGASAAGIRGESLVVDTFIGPKVSSNIQTFSAVPVNGILLTNDSGVGGSNSTANVIINPQIEGVSGYGIVFANADENYVYGGTSEGNGGAAQINGSRNVIEGLHSEANTGSVGFDITGANAANNVLRNVTDNVNYATGAVYIHSAGNFNRIENGYLNSVRIDYVGAANQYTTLNGTTISNFYTNSDPTTAQYDVKLFNGAAWKRLPNITPNISANFGNIANAFTALREITLDTGTYSRRNCGITKLTNFSAHGSSWCDSLSEDGNWAYPHVEQPNGGGFFVGMVAADVTAVNGNLQLYYTQNTNRRLSFGYVNATPAWQLQSWDSFGVTPAKLQLNPQGGVVEVGSGGLSATKLINTGTLTLPTRTGTLGDVIASGTSTFTTTAVGAGACQTTVTTAATNALTTDTISWAYATAPTAATDGMLIIQPYVTANNVNFMRCNPTAGSITPTAIVINWKVI